jgi:hypothetical protein
MMNAIQLQDQAEELETVTPTNFNGNMPGAG